MPDRPPRLERKVAIVTDAGSSGPGIGNGKATSVLFTREGARVLLVDAFPDRAEETLAMIKEEGGEVSVFQADVTDAEDCRRMVEVTEEQWDHIMAVNVKSIVLASNYAIPSMLETGGGSIINISSIAGLRAHSSTPYTTSKAAVIGLTTSMAADHGRDNIRVNCIAPGLADTPMAAGRMDHALREHRKSSAPLGTEGTAWDIANALLFLASDEARWITGVVLPVDAGLLTVTPATYTTLAPQQHDRP